MRTRSIVAGCVGLLFSAVLVAADSPYVGRWKVNEDKTDYGLAFTFSRSESGELRLTQGDLSYIVRFDGQDTTQERSRWDERLPADVRRATRSGRRMEYQDGTRLHFGNLGW